MSVLSLKLKEVLYAVLPITVIVIILNFTIAKVDSELFIRFIIGVLFVIVGLTIFLIGVDVGITPIGNILGKAIANSNRIWILLGAGLLLGFFISVAEPDLHILANQIEIVTGGGIPKIEIVLVVSLGIGVMVALGFIRAVFNIPLYIVLIVLYGLILILSIFSDGNFLAIAFDSSGATTGALTVPFILALALGITRMKKDSKASEKDSFGLVGIASVGAIVAVLMRGLFSETQIKDGGAVESDVVVGIIQPFLHKMPEVAVEVLMAILPVLLIFLFVQMVKIRMARRNLIRILFGAVFTFLGLVLFLTGVGTGFMEMGEKIGAEVSSFGSGLIAPFIGFVLGVVTILAEPAVHVLTRQVDDVTSGYVNKKLVMLTLSLGVGMAIALSVLRVMIPDLKLWHYLLPGYIIAIALMFFTPKLFVGIAFDSGGVASGPMTATFILAYIQGAASSVEGASVLSEGFGMIAMVAMTPLIALQILGLIFKVKSKKGGLQNGTE